jgi:type I restriction enzyme, S subunit
MSETALTPLYNLVSLITDRVSVNKDPVKPYVGLEHIPSNAAVLCEFGSAGDSISTNTVFRSGDILFGKLRPRLRKSVRASVDGYCSTDILVLRPSEPAHPRFAAYVLQSDSVFTEAIRTEEGTKMPRCSWREIRDLPVFCPSRSHQQRIAEILSMVDDAIEQTEALIAKYQQIKAGLMHDLFTRGVTPDGRLRPTCSEAPLLYKETSSGSIPRDWRVERLEGLIESLVDGPFGSNLKTEHYVAEPGVRVVRLQNIEDGRYDDTDQAFISENHAEYLSRNQVKPGDILIAGLGEDNNVVGRACC